MIQTDAVTTEPRATGKWRKTTKVNTYRAGQDTFAVYTFTADSGHTAVMQRLVGRRNPYTCIVKKPTGETSHRISADGDQLTGMEMHLRLPEAKLTVEERVHQIQQQENQPDTQGKGQDVLIESSPDSDRLQKAK